MRPLAGLLAVSGMWITAGAADAAGYQLAPYGYQPARALGYQPARAPPPPLRLRICSSRRRSVCVFSRQAQGAQARMGLEFPRREVQQSREYNVARVRGGYYLSDKDGDAPLEEVIRSKTADVGQQYDHPGGPGGAQEVGAGEDPTTDFVVASKYMPSLDAGDPIVKAQILKSAIRSLNSKYAR
jgi:hypothetical protein